MSNESFGIGTSAAGLVVVTVTTKDTTSTIHTHLTPEVARIYAAAMIALADALEPAPAPGLSKEK